MITRIRFTLTMNRKLTNEDIVSPGGYEIEVDGKRTGFDFFTSYSSFFNNSVTYEAEELDLTAFPNSENITPALLKKAIFTEFYIDTDDDETLYPINISNLVIEFADGSIIKITQKKLGDIVNIFKSMHTE